VGSLITQDHMQPTIVTFYH